MSVLIASKLYWSTTDRLLTRAPQILHSISINTNQLKEKKKKKQQGSHQESNPGSRALAAGSLTTEPRLPTATWASPLQLYGWQTTPHAACSVCVCVCVHLHVALVDFISPYIYRVCLMMRRFLPKLLQTASPRTDLPTSILVSQHSFIGLCHCTCYMYVVRVVTKTFLFFRRLFSGETVGHRWSWGFRLHQRLLHWCEFISQLQMPCFP